MESPTSFKLSHSRNKLLLALSLFCLRINLPASSVLAEEKTRMEVIGTSSMKLLIDYLPMAGHLFMYAMIGLSYYLLSFAIKKVPVGVAYAFWEGIGIVLITIISVLFFGEKIGLNNIIALGIMITGIVCIKYGTQSYESKEKMNY